MGRSMFEGKAIAHNDVAAWLDALAKQKGLTQPYFTKSEAELIGSETAVSFDEPGDDHRGRSLGSIHAEGGQLT